MTAEQAIAYPRYAPNLPAFCRLGAYITTSNISRIYFEVWMLSNASAWNGKMAMAGNVRCQRCRRV